MPDIPSVEDKMAAVSAFEEDAMAALTTDESDGGPLLDYCRYREVVSVP
jgi:hypothetical protein